MNKRFIVNKNEHLKTRIEAMFSNLKAGYEAGKKLSSASKGVERELFISTLLSQVMPIHTRFTSGDITDSSGVRSGQVDIVLEFPRGFSFPIIQDGPRLFVAENVCAVIEVKSDISNQWSEVVETTEKIKKLNRVYAYERLNQIADDIEQGQIRTNGNPIEEAKKLRQNALRQKNNVSSKIPIYAVGLEGWKKSETIKDKVNSSEVDGIFVINEKKFYDGKAVTEGSSSMLAFLTVLETAFKQEIALFPAVGLYDIN